MEHAKIHDNSKMTCKEELNALAEIIDDDTCMKDPTKLLEDKQKSIELHWKHNSHYI